MKTYNARFLCFSFYFIFNFLIDTIHLCLRLIYFFEKSFRRTVWPYSLQAKWVRLAFSENKIIKMKLRISTSFFGFFAVCYFPKFLWIFWFRWLLTAFSKFYIFFFSKLLTFMEWNHWACGIRKKKCIGKRDRNPKIGIPDKFRCQDESRLLIMRSNFLPDRSQKVINWAETVLNFTVCTATLSITVSISVFS